MLAILFFSCGSLLGAGSERPIQGSASATSSVLVDTGSREWNQPRGGPAGTSFNDVAPITSAPVEAWKVPFKSVDGEPVAWGGILYAIVTVPESRGRRLVAIDLSTGKPAAKPAPAPDGFTPILAVWRGMVALLGGNEITFFSQRGDQLVVREKKVAGAWPSAPCVHEGYLFACDGLGSLHCVEMQSMKEIGRASAGSGQPAATAGEHAGEVVIASVGSAGQSSQLYKVLATGLGTKTPKLASLGSDGGGLFETSVPKLDNAYTALVHDAGGGEDRWFVYTPEQFLTTSRIECHTMMWGTRHLSPIVGQAAIVGESAFGFTGEGALISFRANGSFLRVVPEGTPLPAGARPGPATLARGVLYLGNWAVELDDSRVLWCDPAIRSKTALLPVADGTIVYASEQSEIVCLKDPKVARAVATTAIKPAKRASSAVKTSAPGAGEGVVLADGRRIAGKVTAVGASQLRVTPEQGDAQELDVAEVALVEDSSGARLVGAEQPVYAAFWSVLREAWLEGSTRCFEEYRDGGFPDEAQRVLATARDAGLDEARAADLARTLTGTTSNRRDNADKQRAKIRADEDALHERSAAACVRAADWCRAHSIATAASVLLAQADRLQPGQKLVMEKAAALVPAGFLDARSDDAPRRWLQLAEAILPVAGEVVPPGDAAWERVKAAPWDRDAFGVRTANVVLFSREPDAVVVGNCLRHAERTVRVLRGVLGEGTAGDARRARKLDVRLHKSRADYLAEMGDNARAMEWTAGYYSPAEGIARFYVPREQRTHNALERSLEHVVIHELTHDYISERWLPHESKVKSGDASRGGFWIVEGFARFIEDQVAEMDRRGERFDDETVSSLDAACRVSAAGKLFPLDQFVELSQKRFHELSEKPVAVVQLRNTIARVPVTEKSVFYEEAGSLVFYLMNKAGAERRKALIEYLRAWYESRLEPRSWESLGFANASELDQGFAAFLADVASR